jgi:hypothetical protein
MNAVAWGKVALRDMGGLECTGRALENCSNEGSSYWGRLDLGRAWYEMGIMSWGESGGSFG